MKNEIPVEFDSPDIPFTIVGTRLAEFPTGGIQVLLHRCISLSQWKLRGQGAPVWRLYYPLSDGARAIEGENVTILQANHLYLIPPHSVLEFEATKEFSKWYFHFTVEANDLTPAPGIYEIPPGERLSELLHEVCPNLSGSVEFSPFPKPWRVIQLLSLALEFAPGSLWDVARSDQRLENVVAMMEAHLTEKITLAEIANHSGMSERGISKLFVRHTGMSPIRYLIELRLNQATRLLCHTNQSIEAIAEHCGLTNRFYLTRLMKKYRHTTPAAMRAEQ